MIGFNHNARLGLNHNDFIQSIGLNNYRIGHNARFGLGNAHAMNGTFLCGLGGVFDFICQKLSESLSFSITSFACETGLHREF